MERKVNDPDRGWSVVKKHTQRGIPYTAINFRLPSSSEEGMQSGEAVYVYAENVVQKEKNIIEQIREIVTIGTTFDSRFIDNYLFTSSASRCQSLSAEICINGSGENDIAFGTQYIEQTLLPSLPMISMVYTGFGYGPVFTDRRINIRPISLVRGRKYIFDRSTEIQESPVEQIYNKFTYRYSFNAMTNNYEKVVELDRQNNKLCEASEINFGIREYEPVDSICVYDDVTANYIINWLAAHYSFPSYYVEYEGVAGLFFLLSLGDNILLTDDKLEFVDIECTVEKLQYQHSKCTIGLRMWLAYANKAPVASSGTPLAPRTFSLYTGASAFRNIQLSTTGIAPAAGTAFTMSMWIYMIDGVYEGNIRTFWSTNASSGSSVNSSVYLRVSFLDSRFEIQISNNTINGNNLFYGGINPHDLTDGWHLFTVTFDGIAWDSTNHVYFYIDGVLNPSTSAQIRNDSTDQLPLREPTRLTLLSGLGTTSGSSADCHECYIADCTFFNAQLTGAEVEELYNSGSHYDPTTHSQASKLTSWWKFDDVGTSVINTNDATIEDVKGSNDVSTTVTDISSSLAWNSIYKGP